jgi:hypothetical protein
VRRSHPETVFKLVNLTPGEQIVALRAGEIDIGITNDIRVVSKTDTIDLPQGTNAWALCGLKSDGCSESLSKTPIDLGPG